MAESPMTPFIAMAGKPPEEAKFFWSGGPVEAPRTWFQSQLSGVTGFETDEGLVLVDSGLHRLAPRLAALLRQKTQAPVHTVIFTQGHVDHAFGVGAFLAPGQPRGRASSRIAPCPSASGELRAHLALQRRDQRAPVRRQRQPRRQRRRVRQFPRAGFRAGSAL